MNRAMREGESPERKVTVALTRRDILLLKLCLQLVEQEYGRGGALCFDIQRLRDKLSLESGESG